MELTYMPELVQAVPEWTGTAEALASKLLEVANGITEDEPPIRTPSCGLEGTWHCSLKKCPFDITRACGVYTPEYAWERKVKEAEAAKWATPLTATRNDNSDDGK